MDGEGEADEAGVGADVRGRLLAADVLLARRERQHEAALAFRVHRLATEAPRHLADMLVVAGEEAEVRPAEAEPAADRLAFAHHDIDTHRAGRTDRAEGDGFRHHGDQQRALLVAARGKLREVGDMAEEVGVLHDDAARLVVDGGEQRGDVVARGAFGERRHGADHFVVGEMRECLRDRDVVRMEARRQQRLRAAGDAARHEDRLHASGRAVIHRGVRHIHAGEARDLRLELEQVLQRALRDLGLIGRVAGQELAALDQVIDAGRHMVLVGAAAEEERHVRGGEVLPRHGGERALDLHLAQVERQALDRAGEPRGGGHVAEQVVDAGSADLRKHRGAVVRGEGQVSHSLLRFCGCEAQPHVIRHPVAVRVAEDRPQQRHGFLDHGFAVRVRNLECVEEAGAEGGEPRRQPTGERSLARDDVAGGDGEPSHLQRGAGLGRGHVDLILVVGHGIAARLEDAAQPGADRGDVAEAATFGDEAPARLQRAMHAGEDGGGIGHPVQRGVREDGVELGAEREALAVHHLGVEALRPGRRDHRGVGIGAEHRRASLDQHLRQHAVAAAEIEDAFARPWREQIQHGSPKRRHERRVGGVFGRIEVMLPRHRALQIRAERGVGVRVHQRRKFRRIADAHAEEPAV